MRTTICAICNTNQYDALLYEANFTHEHLTTATFSARRLPDRIRYRMVRCTRCGLVRANPILETSELARLYEGSRITYEADKPGLIATYRHYLARALHFGNAKGSPRTTGSPGCKSEEECAMPTRSIQALRPPAVKAMVWGSLLEIGCGDGFFLAEARRIGLNEVKGVEPSTHAIAAADPELQPHIIQGLYHCDCFPPSTFDYACLFQVIDHMDDPARCLDTVHEHLKPGGIALMISHNWDAFTNRALGASSPIIDIEHPFLFSIKTITELLSLHHFRVLETGAAWNTHTIRHWIELIPLPLPLKKKVLKFLTILKLSEIKLTIPAGNFYLIAQKI
ncbi:MAG: class I SAM-dependent methyltransferase [Patescibacteria group bacterium]